MSCSMTPWSVILMHPEESGHELVCARGRCPETLKLKLIKKSKEVSYSVLTHFEAMHALTALHSNPDVNPEQDIHVVMEGT